MQAVYYRAADGSEPVDAFIEALRDPDRQGALDNQIERLNMLRPNDPPLPFPWSSQLEGELRELRCHYGSELYRVLYRRSGNLLCCCTCSARTAARCRRRSCGSRGSAGRTSGRGWTPSGGGRRAPPATTAP